MVGIHRGRWRRCLSRGAQTRGVPHEHGAGAVVFAPGFAQNEEDVAQTVVRVEIDVVHQRLPVDETAREVLEFVFQTTPEGSFSFFPLDAAEAGDVVGAFVFPAVEGGLGNVELLGDVAEAFAGRAEFYELVFGVVGMHN